MIFLRLGFQPFLVALAQLEVRLQVFAIHWVLVWTLLVSNIPHHVFHRRVTNTRICWVVDILSLFLPAMVCLNRDNPTSARLWRFLQHGRAFSIGHHTRVLSRVIVTVLRKARKFRS
jgi:hypothetical protein